ncbi:MAG: PIN domain nuclease [Cyanobacteria bacterium J06560_6]
MMLTDAGPLFALFDKGQKERHRQCVDAYRRISSQLTTTWPCFTEAMYLLYEASGWSGQSKLWEFWNRNFLLVHNTDTAEQQRMKVLMEKYRDTPMDLADASLVAAAERLKQNRVFTLDSDFYVYRINDKDAFEIIS